MRKLTIHFSIPFMLIFLFFSQILQAQMIVNSGPEVTPIDMVESILGEGVLYSNVTYQGADIASGIFSNGDSTNIGIDKGIFLTSGAGYIIPGPNNASGAGVSNALGGHPSLNAITTNTTYDASVLEFDIIPEYDTLKFRFVFGSEEYPYQNPGSIVYSDVCGIFITGLNPSGGYYNDVNIALVPGTALPVTCNTINYTTNSQFFIDNSGGQTIQYNGFTTVLTAILPVVPCEEYNIKLGVADAGDHIIDSGIFLEENSISSGPRIEITSQLNPPGIINSMVEGFVGADIIFQLPNSDFAPLNRDFAVNGTADPTAFPPGDFEEEIPLNISFGAGEDSVAIHIVPVYDEIIEGDENIEFIVETTLGCITRYDTIDLIILDYVEINASTNPNTMICYGQEIDLWVQVYNGIPPYTYLWEPGGFTEDTITVNPEENTTYVVTITDLFEETAQDSVQVIVFPICDLETFYFEAYLNPGLLYDVFGNVTGDTVFIVFPPGTNLNGLIPSFTFSNEECSDTVGTITDFTEPLVYQFIGPGGCMSEWIVIADIETGNVESKSVEIFIFPNPAKDKILISNAQGNKLTVLNSLGTVVLERIIVEDKLNLDVGDLVEGVYYLKFNNDQQRFVEKVIIDK